MEEGVVLTPKQAGFNYLYLSLLLIAISTNICNESAAE